MATSVPGRVEWAVETLAVDSADRLLEIGCGRGVAVSAICEKLTTGKITAIDRSVSMIKLAEQRNVENIAAGKAEFRATALDAVDLGGERFDKIFAINVNLFWVRSASTELDLVRRLLKPDCALYLFYEPPGPTRAAAIAERVVAFLTARGFATTTVTATTRRSPSVACVVARPRNSPTRWRFERS